MQLLITGGTGFIGSRLALRCLRDGNRVKVLGQANMPAEQENCQLLEREGVEVNLFSVADKERLVTLLQGVDVVYHLAAAQHEMNVPDQHFWAVNVDGTRNIVEASRQAGVQRLVHGSTIGVYGSLEGEIHEGSPCNPDNIYGVTKLAGERVVLSCRDDLPVVAVRISEAYGPGDRRLIKLFKAINKGMLFMIGAGQNLHHPIFIDDLIDGLLLAGREPRAVGQVFVLSGNQILTTNEMVAAIAEVLGKRRPRFAIPLPLMLLAATLAEATLRPIGIQPPIHRRRLDFFKKSFKFSQDRQSSVLGFVPNVSFREGVRQTAAWYQQMGYLKCATTRAVPAMMSGELDPPETEPALSRRELAARIEPFDSYWQAPADVEKGYRSFGQYYRHNFLKHMPPDRAAEILVISCGPGYFMQMLFQAGYTRVLGIDSDPGKVAWAQQKQLNCRVARAFDLLEQNDRPYDLIYAGQELNHLTKTEMVDFLRLCHRNLRPGGTLIVYGLNGANPITGAENLAHNFDHFNTFTEYSLRQVLEYAGFSKVAVHPLNLYVFYRNPLNYLLLVIDALYTMFFRFSFMLYGKSVKVLTKKIAAVCTRP